MIETDNSLAKLEDPRYQYREKFKSDLSLTIEKK